MSVTLRHEKTFTVCTFACGYVSDEFLALKSTSEYSAIDQQTIN